jgi:hypothetical protein
MTGMATTGLGGLSKRSVRRGGEKVVVEEEEAER